jgi:hypothetical protein
MRGVKKSLVGIVGITLSLIATAAYVRHASAPRLLASGRFHQVAHKGEGVAAILQLHNGQRVLRLTDFRTRETPELAVLLISAPDAYENQTVVNSSVFVLGALQQAAGSQEYSLPADLDLTRFGAVTIWNKKYQVNFTTAPLRRP